MSNICNSKCQTFCITKFTYPTCSDIFIHFDTIWSSPHSNLFFSHIDLIGTFLHCKSLLHSGQGLLRFVIRGKSRHYAFCFYKLCTLAWPSTTAHVSFLSASSRLVEYLPSDILYDVISVQCYGQVNGHRRVWRYNSKNHLQIPFRLGVT